MDRSHIQPPLRLCFTAFIIGTLGAATGFAASYFSLKLLGQIAFIVVSVAVLTGFVSIGWGWYRIFSKRKPGEQNGR